MLRLLSSPVLALTLGLILVGCSDDGDKPPADTGTPDVPVVDQGTGEGMAPDGAAEDQQVADALQPDTTNPNSDWVEVMTAPDVLNGVWGLDANNVYAVGKGGVILFWDGSKWGAMTNPNNDSLHGLWGNSTKIWAVGDGGSINWDGSAWSQADSSDSYSFKSIMGGTSYLYAPGDSYYLRYRSMTSTGYWSSVSLSGVTSGAALAGVWVFSDNEVYAVGEDATVIKCTSGCANYSSSNWSKETLPSGLTSHLNAIWANSNTDIWAVGNDGAIVHYDGTSWTKMTTGSSTYFHGVWASGPKDVWAVGNPLFNPDEAIFHYDGTSWKKAVAPKPGLVLNGVWGSSATDVWAVGKTSILRYKK